MTKNEFLDTLSMQLQGELSQAQIDGHVHYYREYIAEAVASGKTEREVLEELGSPVLIARTLVDAAKASGAYRSDDVYGREEEYGGQDMWQEPEQDYGDRHVHVWNVNSKVLKIAVAAGLILALFLVLSLMGSLLMFVVRFFVPIVLICLLIHFLRRR